MEPVRFRPQPADTPQYGGFRHATMTAVTSRRFQFGFIKIPFLFSYVLKLHNSYLYLYQQRYNNDEAGKNKAEQPFNKEVQLIVIS